MKLVCIDNGPMVNNLGMIKVAPTLKEGEVYTLVYIDPLHGGYILAEVDPTPPATSFIPRRFIPLSDIDETEFERNYNKELI